MFITFKPDLHARTGVMWEDFGILVRYMQKSSGCFGVCLFEWVTSIKFTVLKSIGYIFLQFLVNVVNFSEELC